MTDDVQTVAVLVTCHNRRDLTKRNLTTLVHVFEKNDRFRIKIFLVDDGSTDGTAEMARQSFENVKVIPGDGQLYWGRGMALAFSEGNAEADWDWFMLFNDDVAVSEPGFRKLLETVAASMPTSRDIFVGALRSKGGDLTYGGFAQKRPASPFALQLVEPNGELQEVDTFNGNIVFVPGSAMRELGGPDPTLCHSGGDLDLGLRARKLGMIIYLFGESVGFCERGDALVGRAKSMPFLQKIRWLFFVNPGVHNYLKIYLRHGSPFYAIGGTVKHLITRTLRLIRASI